MWCGSVTTQVADGPAVRRLGGRDATVRRRFLAVLVGIIIAGSLPACRAPASDAVRIVVSFDLPILDLPTEPWAGGAAYYKRFPVADAAGWSDPSFFPLAVFFGRPADAAQMAAMGVNTYMGAEHGGEPISDVTDSGIFVLAQDEWTPEEVGSDPRVVGWHISDECEMGASGCTPPGTDNGEDGRLAKQQGYASYFRGLDDGRFLQANFGNGVLGTYWAPTTMPDHVSLVDVTSVDKYAYTSTHVQELLQTSPAWPTGATPASAMAYGWLQDRMETFSSPQASKPNWVFVETAKPLLTEETATTINVEQIEGAVWNAIIAGASGIAYFQHNNNDECGMYSLVECSAALRSKVTAINDQVTSLAKLLNSPSYSWNFGPGLQTALKADRQAVYIFAMTDGGTGTRSFALPDDVAGTTVEVVGEDRTIPITNGMFEDTFDAEYTHHIYRVALDD